MGRGLKEHLKAHGGWTLLGRPSGLGLILGALLFAASLTPSLIPRADVTQGVLAGLSFAAGYGCGVLIGEIWRFLQLPEPRGRLRLALLLLAGLASLAVIMGFLGKAGDWQNEIRLRMGMAPTDATHPLRLAATALFVAAVLLALGRLLGAAIRFASRRLQAVLSPRAALLLGFALVGFGAASLTNNYLIRNVIHGVDASAQALDALIYQDLVPPEDPMITGGRGSLVKWEDLGREGRNFVSRTPSPEALAAVTGGDTMRPIRVYVGLNAAETAAERANLALEELIRVGGFERSILVVAMPTGTGWMDPAAMEPLEHLHRGDVATVALQYSYLKSWISLLVDPEASVEAGRALFTTIYGYWRELPPSSRPKLYLYGLSLGAYSSQQSIRMHELIDQPPHGALWVGPPFVSPLWGTLTAERDAGSPAWLPRVGKGEVVRFTDGRGGLEGRRWGRFRIIYLQYASDPIVFFERASAFAPPAWFAPPRGPDVSPDLIWTPVVTFLQLTADMGFALNAPKGHGHDYHPAHHVDAWLSLTDPPGWDAESLTRLKAHFQAQVEAR